MLQLDRHTIQFIRSIMDKPIQKKKQALEHPKQMRIGGDMAKMVENTI